MRVLFLDINGVLTTAASKDLPSPQCVAELNRILAATGAKIVISSYQRLMDRDPAELIQGWSIRGEVIGQTPWLEEGAAWPGKNAEIQAWLDAAVSPPSSFVILDDDPIGNARHVRTNWQTGLTPDVADLAIAMFNGAEEPGVVFDSGQHRVQGASMLTNEEYENRKWSGFPALRKALSGKKLPQDYGLTSISHTMFDELRRLFEIATLTREHAAEVETAALSMESAKMERDLIELAHVLKGICGHFSSEADSMIDELHAIVATLYRLRGKSS